MKLNNFLVFSVVHIYLQVSEVFSTDCLNLHNITSLKYTFWSSK